MLKFLYLISLNESTIFFVKIINKIIALIANIVMPLIYKLFYKTIGTNDNNDNNIIVSLTSFPDRINTIWITIESLLRQTHKPQKILLWLAKKQFPEEEKSLPNNLLNLKKRGLTIKFCEDLKSYKKFFYTAKLYNDKIIITADDDVIYPNDWIEKLVHTYTNNQDCICCYRAHQIKLDNNFKPLKYKEWNLLSNKIKGPSHLLLATGVGGILYPPSFFSSETLDIDLIEKLCPLTDDIWLKVIELKKNIKVLKVDYTCKQWFKINSSQKNALYKKNINNTINDKALNNLLKYYNITIHG